MGCARRCLSKRRAGDYEASAAADQEFEDNSIDRESYVDDLDDDDDDEGWLPDAQLGRYVQLQRQLDELRDRAVPAYTQVVYRGVKGIFIPETSIARKYGGLDPATLRQRQSSAVSMDDVQSTADDWSVLVREEVKKALDEYDLVYRLADALRSRAI